MIISQADPPAALATEATLRRHMTPDARRELARLLLTGQDPR